MAVLPGDPLVAHDLPGVRVVRDEAALLAELRVHCSTITSPRSWTHAPPAATGPAYPLGSLASGVAHGVPRRRRGARSTMEATVTLLATLDVDDLVDLAAEPTGRL